MNFNQLEKSLDSRQPVRLYEFTKGFFKYTYNSSAVNISYNNQIFKSLIGGISDSGIIRSDGGNSDALNIIAPADIEVAQLFVDIAPSRKVILKIYNTHLGVTEIKPIWQGEVVTVSFAESDRIKLVAIPTESATNKLGATQTYSRQCNAVLYDKRCKVNKQLYKKTGTIMQMNLTSIKVIEAATMPDGWFTAGYIEYDIGDGDYEVRAIEFHSKDSLVLLGGTAGLKERQTINFYAGCNLTKETCKIKFNNLLNMQATPYLKGKSPFDGNPVGW